MSAGPACLSQHSAATEPLRQCWRAQMVEHLDVLWEDHGDMDMSSPLVGQRRLRQSDENETGIGRTVNSHLPSTVNGVPVTTLILRNLPALLTQEGLLRFLPQPNVAKYNLLHLPLKARGIPRSGFAFLNFETHDDAAAFSCLWHGRQVQIVTGGTVIGSTVIIIEVAKHQGFVANLLQWRTAMRGRSMTAALPAVFVDGRRRDFWQHVTGMQTVVFEEDDVVHRLQL